MSDQTFYVTTPIYYVNGAPHLGHAYTSMVADMLARYHRALGKRVFFLTGTDEHGLKVLRAAEALGITAQEIADQNVQRFIDLGAALGITNDDFIRTTEARHVAVAQQLWRRVAEKGDIYLGSYEGWYAPSDEAYYKDEEIEDGHSIVTGSKVEWVVEKSYFFRLSAYQDRLLEYYASHPDFLQPDSRRNEVVRFVEGGLNDLSISRTTFDWGVPVPDDPEHVMYVWFDALSNYLSAIGVLAEEAGFEQDEQAAARGEFWPADVHLIGKDIIRFHGVFWPAFLMSAGLPLPKTIFAHGWWLKEQSKMSKSEGNVVDPLELIEKYGVDPVRYFLFREIPFGNDGTFSDDRVRERNNSELANTFGNLVNRVLAMSKRFLDGVVPDMSEITEGEADVAIREAATSTLSRYHEQMEKYGLHRAAELLMELGSELNGYIQVQQPWALHKAGDQDRVARVLYTGLEGVRLMAVCLAPMIPTACRSLLARLGYDDVEAALQFDQGGGWGLLPAGNQLSTGEVLFPRLESPEAIEKRAAQKAQKAAQKAQKSAKKAAQTPAKPEKAKGKDADGFITYDDFMRTELRVGLVLECERVKGADKLLKLQVDIGEDKPRQVIAGLAQHYAADELAGKSIVVVANLKPAKLRGLISEGMLLATDTDDGGVLIVNPPAGAKPGSRVR